MANATKRERLEAAATYRAAKAEAKRVYLATVKAALADARRVLGPPVKATTKVHVHRVMSQTEQAAYLQAAATPHVTYGSCQCLACQRADRAFGR